MHIFITFQLALTGALGRCGVLDPARLKGVVYAFRGSIADENEHRFVLAGLEVDKRYRLHFEDSNSPDRDVSGGELMSAGLSVHLQEPLSSALVFLDEVAAKK